MRRRRETEIEGRTEREGVYIEEECEKEKGEGEIEGRREINEDEER